MFIITASGRGSLFAFLSSAAHEPGLARFTWMSSVTWRTGLKNSVLKFDLSFRKSLPVPEVQTVQLVHSVPDCRAVL